MVKVLPKEGHVGGLPHAGSHVFQALPHGDRSRPGSPCARGPVGISPGPLASDLLSAHAEAKYLSFRNGIDANVFPCLGEHDGCQRLMREISLKDGFLPHTWLVATDAFDQNLEYCGTIQGIRDRSGLGAIRKTSARPRNIAAKG